MPRLPIEACSSTRATIHGRELLAFGGCNYLGLADRLEVQDAVRHGILRYGLSTTASRETTGNTRAHEALELDLAAFLRQDAAILTAEGYTANIACCQALVREVGVALIDQRAHRSVRDAAMSCGMQVFEYEHLNARSAEWLVRQHADAGVALMTDSVFAADGAIAPLNDLLSILPAHRSALVVDDCHGLAVLGDNGRGAVSHFQLDDPRLVITTTLAKGLGCYGGAVIGREPLIRKVRERAWVYRNSTPVPPALAEGARAALALLQRDDSLVKRLRDNIAAVRGILARLALPLPPEGIPIFTFALDDEARMERVHERLLASGVLVPLIDYPGGPAPRYFRLVVSAAHTPDDITRLEHDLNRALAGEAVRDERATP